MKGQVNQVFIYITAIIVIGMIFLISFAALSTIFERSSEAGVEKFSTGLISQINQHSRTFGAKSREEFSVPNSVEKIYLVDTNILRLNACQIEENYRLPFIIKDLLVEECRGRFEDKHSMFFLTEDDVYQFQAGDIYLNGELLIDLPIDNSINLLFEGRGGKTLVQTLDSYLISLELPSGPASREYVLSSVGNDATAIVAQGITVGYPVGVDNKVSVDRRISQTSFSRQIVNGTRSGINYHSDIFEFRPGRIFFSEPIEIEIAYDPNLNDVNILQTLKVFKLNGTDWIEVPNKILKAAEKTISFKTKEFGSYVIASPVDCSTSTCPSCMASPCGGVIGGVQTRCCPIGLGYGSHYEIYDDVNNACWSECATETINLAGN